MCCDSRRRYRREQKWGEGFLIFSSLLWVEPEIKGGHMLQDLIYISLVADIIYSKHRCRRGGWGDVLCTFVFRSDAILMSTRAAPWQNLWLGGKRGRRRWRRRWVNGDCRRPGDFDGCVKMPRRRTCTMQTHKKKAKATQDPLACLVSQSPFGSMKHLKYIHGHFRINAVIHPHFRAKSMKTSHFASHY